MEPITTITLITAGIPFVTKLFKKVFKTDKVKDVKTKKGLNALIPVVIGVLSAGLYALSQGQDWVTALAVGLGSGGVASSGRDIEKNLVRLMEGISRLVKK